MQESTPFPNKSGKRPYISAEAVRDALRAMLYTDPDVPLAASPLWYLTLVERMLHDPAVPRVESHRHRILNYLLVEEIEAATAAIRERCGVVPMAHDWTKERLIEEFKRLAPARNAELKAWTILYARYVNVGAGVELGEIADALGIDDRHCRRLHMHGVRRMVDRLCDREWAARAQQKRFRLLARIPGLMSPHPIGRDDLFQRAYTLLCEPGQKLLMSGESGMGKKTLVRALLRQMIDADLIDQLLWYDDPPSGSAVLLWIQEAICIEPAQRFALERYLEAYQLLVVINEPTRLLAQPSEMKSLLGRLGRATVVLIHQGRVSLDEISAVVVVPPLGQAAMHSLATQYWHRYQSQNFSTDANLPELIRLSGGSPALLKQYIQGYRYRSAGTPRDDFSPERRLALVSDAARQTLVAFLLSSLDGQTVNEFTQIWGDEHGAQQLDELLAFHVLELHGVNQQLHLAPRWRDWLVQDCTDNGWTYGVALKLLELLDEQLRVGNSGSLQCVERLLQVDWLKIPPVRAFAWLEQGWHVGVVVGRWASWLHLLRQATQGAQSAEPSLWMGRGICARFAAEWDESAQAFQTAIRLAGEVGRFELQAEVLLEHSILLRKRGYLGLAADGLQDAGRRARRYGRVDLLERLSLEQAQLAAEREDGAAMLESLSAAKPTFLVSMLTAEAYCLLGNLDACANLLHELLAEASADLATRARLHTVMARVHRARKQFDLARRECETALTLLEQTDDFYSKARAYVNMGTAILEAGGALSDALALYRLAESDQRAMGDTIALFATQHNINAASLDHPAPK